MGNKLKEGSICETGEVLKANPRILEKSQPKEKNPQF